MQSALCPRGLSVRLSHGEVDGWAWLAVADDLRSLGSRPSTGSGSSTASGAPTTARSRPGGGSGLGLAIVRQIAEAHRGSVDVHSDLGAGATFVVWLPRTSDPGEAPDVDPTRVVALAEAAPAPARTRRFQFSRCISLRGPYTAGFKLLLIGREEGLTNDAKQVFVARCGTRARRDGVRRRRRERGQDRYRCSTQASGTITLAGWASSPTETKLLKQVIRGFEKTFPTIKVDYAPISGDYPAAMLAKFAARTPPDVFYVDSNVRAGLDQAAGAPAARPLHRQEQAQDGSSSSRRC